MAPLKLRIRLVAAGALLLFLASCTAHAQPELMGPRTVEVTIKHSRFLPSEFEFDSGETVRFLITNQDPIDHEFIIGDETVQDRHENGTEAEHGEVPGEVTIHAMESAVTTFEFSGPGVLLIGCHAPGHYDYGMRGTIHIHPTREK